MEGLTTSADIVVFENKNATCGRSQSMKSIAYVGMDVHKDTISVALYVGDDRDPLLPYPSRQRYPKA
jgi:hypothetical protein